MSISIDEFLEGKSPLTDAQVERVQEWLDEDWEACDMDRDAINLIRRLVITVKARTTKAQGG